MTLTMAHVILLPCLVATVTTAPVAEQANNQEQVVNVKGDNKIVSRAKRAKEEIVFGNQQNGGRLSAAKKTVGFPYPPYFNQQDVQPSYNYRPQGDNMDKAGYVYASQQVPDPIQEETMSELQALEPEGSQDQQEDVEKQQDNSDLKVTPTVAEVEQQEQAEPIDKTDTEKEQQETQVPEVEEPKTEEQEEEEAEQVAQSLEPILKAQAAPPPVEPEVQNPVMSRPPQDSRRADAEEALQAQDQIQKIESDDIESFLKALQEPNEMVETQNEGDGEGTTDEEKEEHTEKEEVKEEDKEEQREEVKQDEQEEEKEDQIKEDEGTAEEELLQIANKDAEAAEQNVDADDYTKKLLDYILLHGDEYGRVPVNYGYPYPGSYYVQRRRRSLAHRRLPHIHRRRRSGSSRGKQLARSKRTKRDLFDDELYYNPAEQYELQEAVEEAEKEAEMDELISYLMALYPALYDNQPPPQNSPYPGYLWYGSNYPEESYPEYSEWVEPEYVEVPVGVEPVAAPPVPAWEPAFYPEEVEEPNYYPAPVKRQMLNMFPEQRRKRYFYPYAREPYAHWGAFIPSMEKRDYDNAYRRLKDLAMVLADARQPSPYFDAFSDYRKK